MRMRSFLLVAIAIAISGAAVDVLGKSLLTPQQTLYSAIDSTKLLDQNQLRYRQAWQEQSFFLRKMATVQKKRRISNGVVAVTLGSIELAMVATNEDSEFHLSSDDAGTVIAIGTSFGLGFWDLVIPSKAERELRRVEDVDDYEERVRNTDAAIGSIASSAETQRLLRGAVFLGLGSVILVAVSSTNDSLQQDDEQFTTFGYLVGVTFCVVGLHDMIVTTPEEKIFEQYRKSRWSSYGLNFGVGPDRRGGVKFGMALTF